MREYAKQLGEFMADEDTFGHGKKGFYWDRNMWLSFFKQKNIKTCKLVDSICG
jgi:hypothetical protein